MRRFGLASDVRFALLGSILVRSGPFWGNLRTVTPSENTELRGLDSETPCPKPGARNRYVRGNTYFRGNAVHYVLLFGNVSVLPVLGSIVVRVAWLWL